MDGFLAGTRFIALYGVSYGLVLFVIAIGLVITFGLMRVANLAHGVFAAAGGYVCFVLANSWGVGFGWALLASVVLVSAASIVVEKLFFAYLYDAPELDQVVTTIGLCFICVAALSLGFGPNVMPVRLPAGLARNVDVLGTPFPAYRLFVTGVGAAIVAGLWFVFDKTNYGARLRAAVDNRSMAQATGISVDRYFSSAFALGAGLAAMGGAVGAVMLPLDPMYPFKYLPMFLTVVALAGMGNIKTSLPVAVLVGCIDTAGRYLVPQYAAFTVYLLLIALMLWRPNGLLTPERRLRAAVPAGSHALTRYRLHWAEPLWWLAALACFFAFPDFHSFGASVLIMSLFATSLSLLIGVAGIISLGHAAFFGIGAYGAGLLALAGWHEPITNALAAGVVAGVAGLVIGPLILRLRGLALLMVTLAIGMVFYELANKATAITGGDDGLIGIVIGPVFGRFDWTVDGSTAYLYVLAWLLVVFVPVRRLVNSPFGLSLVGLRDNPVRMRLVGARVLWMRVVAYACSALMAGIAGALSAQTTAFVGLQVFSVETSVDALVMAIVGGIANLYGGMIGAPLYMIVKYFSQQWNPFYWMFFVGCLLVVVPRFGRGGALQLLARVVQAARPIPAAPPPAPEHRADVLQGAAK